MYRSVVLLVAIIAIGALAAACSAPAATTTGAPSLAPATVAPTTAQASATTGSTGPARVPAPAELQGRWQVVIGPADTAILTIRDFVYSISYFDLGGGSITVDGDKIVFYGSPPCPGDGTYSWSISGDQLHLEPFGSDACPLRATAISGRTFNRLA